MTHDQLTKLFLNRDNNQIQQAISYVEQQQQIPQELFIECLVAFQLIENEDLRKDYIKFLKKYLPKDWHVLLQNKYLLQTYQSIERNKAFAKKLAQMLDVFPITLDIAHYKDWIAYLFPHFPELLWQVFFHENRFTETEIEEVLQKVTIKELDFSFLDFTELTPFIIKLQNLEKFSWKYANLETIDLTLLEKLLKLKILDLNNSKIQVIPSILNLEELTLVEKSLAKVNLSPLGNLKNLKKLYLIDCSIKEVPAELSKLTNLEVLHLYRNPIETGEWSFLDKVDKLKEFR